MFWIIQKNMYSENNHENLIMMLERMNIDFIEVKILPSCNKLLPSNFDINKYNGELKDVIEPEINTSGLIMLCGATTMTKISKERGWLPGSFLNDNFHFKCWLSVYGDNLLNSQTIVDTFENIEPEWGEFFIRPCEDSKYFSGKVLSRDKFLSWKHEVLGSNSNNMLIHSNVIASPTKKIYAEYRFFVVDGKIITYSQYKRGLDLFISDVVIDEAIEFAEKMVYIWQPARAFVIDIAYTSEGYKIVEFNNINSSGFYACNIGKIIEAIENMVF